jgi:O-antigen/teichoic acid export membrane protein
MHCLRLPYNIMVLAAGHYKQTQWNYIIAAILNIIISVLAVKSWGLIGVAIGTLIAMSYQTIWLSWYDSNNFIHYPMKLVVKQFLVDGVTAVSAITTCQFLKINELSYSSWVLMAVKATLITGAFVIVINTIFYRIKMIFLIKKVVRR